jgi:hypothetical protein
MEQPGGGCGFVLNAFPRANPPNEGKDYERRMISFADRVTVPSNVLIRFLDQEAVLLNLETERYFGLDAVGARMWQVVMSAPTIGAAFFELVEEYDVAPDTLRSNLTDLLNHLVENGLIETQPADVGTASPV